MLRTRGQDEDRVQVLGGEHVLDPGVCATEAPAPHERPGVGAARDERGELHVVALDQGGQLGDGGDVPRSDDADSGPGLRAHRVLPGPAAWAMAERTAAADRAKPTAGSGRSSGCHRYSYSRESTSS